MLQMMRIATVTLALLCTCVMVAQAEVRPNETREELASRIDRVLTILDAIHRPGRAITISDIDNLKKAMRTLGEKALGTYLAALIDTLIAAETEGKRGDQSSIGTMEETMKFLTGKARRITTAIKDIQEKIRNGQLVLSKELLPRTSDQELRNAISDKGLEIYRKKKLLSADRIKQIQELKREQYSSLSEPCSTCDTPTSPASTFFRRIIDALIPSAYAEMASPCTSSCVNLTNFSQIHQCSMCCKNAIDSSSEAFYDYLNCSRITSALGAIEGEPSCAEKFLFILG